MNILILGGLGFLGTSVIEDLSTASSRHSIFVASSRKEEPRGSTIFVNYGNLQSVKNLFAKTNPDVILHLDSRCLRDNSFDSLQKGNVRDDNLIKVILSNHSHAKMIFISSMSAFGNSDKKIGPFSFSAESYYGKEKIYMLKKLIKVTSDREFNFKVIYPSSIYGKNQKGNMFLPTLFRHIKERKKMFAYGSQKKRDFINVKDVAHFLNEIITNYSVFKSDHIFINSGRLISLKDISKKICNLKGLDLSEVISFEDSVDDLDDFQLIDKEYIEEDLFIPKISLEKGIRSMFLEA